MYPYIEAVAAGGGWRPAPGDARSVRDCPTPLPASVPCLPKLVASLTACKVFLTVLTYGLNGGAVDCD